MTVNSHIAADEVDLCDDSLVEGGFGGCFGTVVWYLKEYSTLYTADDCRITWSLRLEWRDKSGMCDVTEV